MVIYGTYSMWLDLNSYLLGSLFIGKMDSHSSKLPNPFSSRIHSQLSAEIYSWMPAIGISRKIEFHCWNVGQKKWIWHWQEKDWEIASKQVRIWDFSQIRTKIFTGPCQSVTFFFGEERTTNHDGKWFDVGIDHNQPSLNSPQLWTWICLSGSKNNDINIHIMFTFISM